MRLKSQFTALMCLVAALPIALFWAWPQSRALDAGLVEVGDRNLLIAQQAAESIRRYQSDVIAVFEALQPELESPQVMKIASPLLDHMDFLAVCQVNMADGTARQLISIRNITCPAELADGMAKAVAETASDGRTTLSRLLRQPDGTEVMLAIHTAGNTANVGLVSSDYIVKLGKTVSFNGNGSAIVVDQSGRSVIPGSQP